MNRNLCWLGWHQWPKWESYFNTEMIKSEIITTYWQERRCMRCGWLEQEELKGPAESMRSVKGMS